MIHIVSNNINIMTINPPMHLLKYSKLKICLMQNNILILLLLRKEYISPKSPVNSKILPKKEFLLKSVNGQKQIDSIVFKSTPLLIQLPSHREILGKYI